MPRGLSNSPHDRRETRYLRASEEDAALERADPAAIRIAASSWLSELCPWDLFATLTYDPKRTGYLSGNAANERIPPGPWACGRHFARWVDLCQFRAGRPILAAAALEATRAGWPHFHVVLSMAGCSAEEFRAVGQEWFRDRGYCKLARVDSAGAPTVANYLAKYFTKESVELHFRGELANQVLPQQRWLTGLKVGRSK